MDPEAAPYRMLAFLIAMIVVVVAAVLAWNVGSKNALVRTPPVQPRLSPQPTELERYRGRAETPPPAEPLAKTDQNASPPPAEPLAKTQQPTPITPPAEPLAQAQNPMQGQSLQAQPYTPLTEELFVQIAAEIALTPAGEATMPQDMMGLAVPAVRIFERYRVNIMEYYQRSQEWLEGPRQEEFQRRIQTRIAQLRQLQATPQPQAPALLPATAATPRKRGR